MIRIENLQKKFYKGDVHALKGINLEIPTGEFVVLIGANGSGKSTLLNAIAGNVIADAGVIMFDDINITSLPDHKRNKWISRIFQNPLAGTAPGLSVLENFRLASLRTKRKTLKIATTLSFKTFVSDRIAELNMDLENKLDQPMGALSGGQRQALTLLMSVMDNTRLLLMDEPVSALDPRTAELVMNLAERLIQKHKLTAILVTHSLRDALLYGNRIIQMAEGSIIKDLRGIEKTRLGKDELFSWF